MAHPTQNCCTYFKLIYTGNDRFFYQEKHKLFAFTLIKSDKIEIIGLNLKIS